MSLASLPRPLRLALYVGAAAVLLALTLAPSEDLPSVNLWDKAEHAVAWMVLTGLGLVLSPRRPRAIAGFALAFGALVEILQGLLPIGRDADIRDLLADSVGIGAALLVYLLVRGARRR